VKVQLFAQAHHAQQLIHVPALTDCLLMVPCAAAIALQLSSNNMLENAKETADAARAKGTLILHCPITCKLLLDRCSAHSN